MIKINLSPENNLLSRIERKKQKRKKAKEEERKTVSLKMLLEMTSLGVALSTQRELSQAGMKCEGLSEIPPGVAYFKGIEMVYGLLKEYDPKVVEEIIEEYLDKVKQNQG